MQYLETTIQDRIGTITLNRPEKRNALSYDLVTELKEAFQAMAANDAIRVIILQADGKVFSAGADLAYIEQLQNNTFEENVKDSNHLKELFQLIYEHPKPVIAKVHGHAIAGGCGLATVCDFVLAAEEAKFGYTEVRIGFIPALVSVFLIRKIGEGRARELLLSGELYSAPAVQQMGLINKVYPAQELDAGVNELAQQLIQNNSGQSMALTKKMIAEVQHLETQQALNHAAQLNAEARGSEDCKRGIAAFLNKEKITW